MAITILQSDKVLNTDFLEIFDDIPLDVGNTSEVKAASIEGIKIIAKTMDPFDKNQGESSDPLYCTRKLFQNKCLSHFYTI